MSRQPQYMRTAFVLFAALLMSSVAVGTAVGPAHAVANPFQAAVHA